MTIRYKILLSCLVFLLCTLSVGGLCFYHQRQLQAVAKDIYDQAFMGVNYARKAQLDFVRFADGYHGDAPANADQKLLLGKVKDELDVAIERAGTEHAKQTAQVMLTKVIAIFDQQSGSISQGVLDDINADLAKLSERYATDGSNYRDHVDDIITHSDQMLLIETSIALVLALITAGVLIRTVLPPLRRASAVATETLEAFDMASEDIQKASITMAGSARITTNMVMTVSGAAEEATSNVQAVASAAEELSVSFAEVVNRIEHTAAISSAGAEQAKKTTQIIERLVEAAKRIGEVVNLINTIAGQTNLLALNATIEAARAGAAGKGFSVVASEVKSLASQTAKATEDIRQQVATIQGATQESVEAINVINETINNMSHLYTSILTSVSQQTQATNEIAGNVHQAADGTGEVSRVIANVAAAAEETGAAADTTQTIALRLSEQTANMRIAMTELAKQIR